MKPISIIGGGLAGLSLGHALVRLGIDTTVVDSGTYPRHRVCGEFIAGLREATIDALGLADILAEAKTRSSMTWFRFGSRVKRQQLRRPALAIARHELDLRLAESFVAKGGTLKENTRADLGEPGEGVVMAHGRRREPSDWIGLKAHVRGLHLESDLEFHLGRQAYVGICEIDNDRANVCGLFRRREIEGVTRTNVLQRYIEVAGLTDLAVRIEEAEIDPASCCAVAGLQFSTADSPPDRICLGDAFAMIPPFTGNGMAMAFQSAALALPSLAEWARGRIGWKEVVVAVNQALQQHFRRRLQIAEALHPFMLQPTRQKLFTWANRSGILPFHRIAGAIHS